MTAKEKAIELVKKYSNIVVDVFDVNFDGRLIRFDNKTLVEKSAKECAIIAVDEIYKLRMTHGQHLDYDVDKINYYSYWEQVKQEIEKL